jgi:hypothetical protein
MSKVNCRDEASPTLASSMPFSRIEANTLTVQLSNELFCQEVLFFNTYTVFPRNSSAAAIRLERQDCIPLYVAALYSHHFQILQAYHSRMQSVLPSSFPPMPTLSSRLFILFPPPPVTRKQTILPYCLILLVCSRIKASLEGL